MRGEKRLSFIDASRLPLEMGLHVLSTKILNEIYTSAGNSSWVLPYSPLVSSLQSCTTSVTNCSAVCSERIRVYSLSFPFLYPPPSVIASYTLLSTVLQMPVSLTFPNPVPHPFPFLFLLSKPILQQRDDLI